MTLANLLGDSGQAKANALTWPATFFLAFFRICDQILHARLCFIIQRGRGNVRGQRSRTIPKWKNPAIRAHDNSAYAIHSGLRSHHPSPAPARLIDYQLLR
jgi:hypothetical protein